MKRTISTDEIAKARAQFQGALAKAKTETAQAQKAFNDAQARLDRANAEQARIEGAIKALEGLG